MGSARPRALALGLSLVVLTTACTLPSRSSRSLGAAAASPSAAAAPTTPAQVHVDTSGDRLIVLRADGNLTTIGPDGKDELPMTTGAGPSLLVQQPVASPDGRYVAWAEAEAASGGGRVVIEARDGSTRDDVALQLVPFYLEWDPTSSRIAYLGNAGEGIGLGIVEHATSDPSDHPVGGGRPLYLSWSPDGTRMLVHVGTRELGRTNLTQGLRSLGVVPGTFQAPVWLPDGRLVYVARHGKDQRLVVAGGGNRRVIATFRGGVLFDASPDGTVLAYRLDAPGGAQVGVFVADLGGGRPTRVTDRRTSAFFWSPRGDALLLMSVEPHAAVKQTHRWWLWDGRTRAVSKPFLPSPTFLQQYVPFFDQYAQTLTPWSPDGSAFAFAGLIHGTAGVWVQPADGSPAHLVTDGEFVAWAPSPS